MTAVVSRERAKATCLTGAAGVLLLAIALVMMVMAAPGHAQGSAKPPSVAQLTTDVGHQHPPARVCGHYDAYLRFDLDPAPVQA